MDIWLILGIVGLVVALLAIFVPMNEKPKFKHGDRVKHKGIEGGVRGVIICKSHGDWWEVMWDNNQQLVREPEDFIEKIDKPIV